MSTKNDCCEVGNGAGLPFNPKTYSYRGKKSINDFRYFEIENPLPDQISDSREMQDFFGQMPFVPFAGYDAVTAHSLLKKFIDFRIASVTTGAVLNSINSYSFGGKINIVKNFMPEFDLGEEAEELTREEKINFGQFIKGIDLGGMNYTELAEFMTVSDELTGNVFAELINTETIGVKNSKVVLHNPLNCLYLSTLEGERKYIAISKSWEMWYVIKYPPRIIPLFDKMDVEGSYKTFSDGTTRTMFHQKNGMYEWYGRPPAESAIIDQYNEHSIRTYLSKQASKAFIGQTIIETEDDDPKNPFINRKRDVAAGYKNTADRFEHNFTNRGQDPSSFMLLTRSFGAKPVSVTRIPPMTDAKFVRESLAECRNNISMAFDWSEALLRKEKTSGFNSDMYRSLVEIQSATKVLRVQNRRSSFIGNIIGEVGRWNERSEFENYGMKFKSTIQNIIEQKVESEKLETTQKKQNDNNGNGSN